MLKQREGIAAEEARIRAAYQDRTGDEALYAWSSPGHLFLMQSRERNVLRLLQRRGCMPLADQEILEVGCGKGTWLRDMIRWGASPDRLHGVELRPEGVELARRLCPGSVRVEQGSATQLPYADETFDLVLQSMVFSSVLDREVRGEIATEMLRVLSPLGTILWYDFFVDNPRNPDVRGVRCPEIEELFPGCAVRLHRTTLAPPIARLLAPRSWLVSHLLESLPLLRTHYLGTIRRI